MQYYKLKLYTGELPDLGQPVTETLHAFHLLHGLGCQYHNAIHHITLPVSAPSSCSRSTMSTSPHTPYRRSRRYRFSNTY